MIYILVLLLILNIIFLSLELIVFKVSLKVIEKQRQGRVFVRVVCSDQIYGWIMDRDLTSIRNNSKPNEEHIRIEGKTNTLVQIRNIKELYVVKKFSRIVIRNL